MVTLMVTLIIERENIRNLEIDLMINKSQRDTCA